MDCNTTDDLISVNWNYISLVGMRVAPPVDLNFFFDESRWITLRLVQLTGYTYMIISVIFMLRKVVLWCLIITSPIIPFLYLYPNTHSFMRAWLSTLLKWTLYAPLFAVLIQCIAYMTLNWPISFVSPDIGDPNKIVFPTSTNLYLGMDPAGPTFQNSINTTDTFAQYLFALVMIWIAILLPLLLMRWKIPQKDDSGFFRQILSIMEHFKLVYLGSKSPETHNQTNIFTMPNLPFLKRSIQPKPKTEPPPIKTA